MWLKHQMNGGQVILLGCGICFRFLLFTTSIERVSWWFGWVSKCRWICCVEYISDESTCIAWRRCCGTWSGGVGSCQSLIGLAIGCNSDRRKRRNVLKIASHWKSHMIFMKKKKRRKNRTINNPTVSHSALIWNHRSNRPVTHFTFSLAFAELDFRVKYYNSRWLFITVTIYLELLGGEAIIVKFIAPQCGCE